MAANQKLVDTVKSVAARHGATPAQVALAWVLAAAPDAVPIPGTKRRTYLDDNLGAVNVHLTAEDMAELDRSGVDGGGRPLSAGHGENSGALSLVSGDYSEVRRGARPRRCVAGGKRFFAGFVHFIFRFFFRLRGIGRQTLFRFGLVLFHKSRLIKIGSSQTHINTTSGPAKSFAWLPRNHLLRAKGAASAA